MKEKKLLIVERSNAPLNYSVEQVINENNEQSDSIVLTGLFTSFNTKNRNGLILSIRSSHGTKCVKFCR